jgi:[protein-PII] uridylyltransferase
VTIDNRTSEEYTVIDVFTQDRVGLLFAITYTLFQLELRIHLARITTNADQALDVFYLSDREGNKITDIAAQRELRQKLLERLEDRPPESVAAQT